MKKRKSLKIIARFTVFFRMTIMRDARVNILAYKYQKLENPFEFDNDEKTIVKLKEKLQQQELLIKALTNNLHPDKNKIG